MLATVSANSQRLTTPNGALSAPRAFATPSSPAPKFSRLNMSPASPTVRSIGQPSSRSAPSSKPTTPLGSARVGSGQATPNGSGRVVSRPVTSSSAQDDCSRAGSRPMVPMLRLGNTSGNISKVLNIPSETATRKADDLGTIKKVKPTISVKPQAQSLIFKAAEPQTAPKQTAFQLLHRHSNPFAASRQHPFPETAKKVSLPHTPTATTPHVERKKLVKHPESEDPILQPKGENRAKSPSMHLHHGSCAPPPQLPTESPLRWAPETPKASGKGIRCNSAPASTRHCTTEIQPRGISIRAHNEETLKGVWTSEVKPRPVVQVRAPYAQATPRAATPTPSSRKLSTPYATHNVGSSSRPAVSKASDMPKPFHTTTPRAKSPSVGASYRVQAPFHTSTPREAKPTRTSTINRILQ